MRRAPLLRDTLVGWLAQAAPGALALLTAAGVALAIAVCAPPH